jgi:L-fuculose-phosphate aldolase
MTTAAEHPADTLIHHARAMAAAGLNKGTAGNLSVRSMQGGDAGFLVTPTGMAYAGLEPADIPFVALADGRATGSRKPSSEWRMHLDLYRARPEFAAILHAHSPFATALACLREDIPPFHYMIARFGGETIRCAPYALFGTQALSDVAVAAMEGRSACLLGNHGMIVGADSAARALDLAIELETLCEHWWRARLAGPPVLLTAAEMAEVKIAFAGYGKQQARDTTPRE